MLLPGRASMMSLAVIALGATQAHAAHVDVRVDWMRTQDPLELEVGVQVYSVPQMRRVHRLAPVIWQRLRELKLPIARLQPWYTYPRLAVAELEPPEAGVRRWDTSEIDPIVEDFMGAVAGGKVIWDFGTVPAWLWSSGERVSHPRDPNVVDWNYGAFPSRPRPGALPEIAAYFARLARHYLAGDSGRRYTVDHWEVLNEPDLEHEVDPELYNQLYDAIVPAVRAVHPGLKFGGPSLSSPRPAALLAFMDPARHAPGIPIDFISYHQYTLPLDDRPESEWASTMWTRAEGLIGQARAIEAMRARFVPHAKTFVDELGTMLWFAQKEPKLSRPIPAWYWSASGAVFAFETMALARAGVDMVAMAELFDFPGQFAATTILDWNTGAPNARYWVTQILAKHVRPGGRFVACKSSEREVFTDAFIGADGARVVVLVNRRDRSHTVKLEGRLTVETTDAKRAPPRRFEAVDTFALGPYGVAVAIVSPR